MESIFNWGGNIWFTQFLFVGKYYFMVHNKTFLIDITKDHKNPIKDWWLEPSKRKQKRKAKERPKDSQPVGTKKKGKS